MNEDVELPSVNTTEVLTGELESSRKYLEDSSARANEASSQYREILSSINDRVILLAAGSLSLLLTFLGILVSRDDKLPNLEYKYIFIASVLFLITMVLLFISKWLQALYVFKINHYYYLKDRKLENDTNIKIAETSPAQIADKNTGRPMKAAVLAELVQKMKSVQKGIDNKIKDDKTKSTLYLKASKYVPLVAYILLTLGYASTLYFFIGVINFING